MRTTSRAFVAGLALLTFALGSAGPASAAGSITVDVLAGNTAAKVGTATFTRSLQSNGSETLTVHFAVPGGIEASHVCLQAQPFSGRVSPGQCPYTQGATGTSADYTIDLGRTYVGRDLFVQASVVTNNTTAFAGWLDGSPFYGNVRLAADAATVPVGALGGLALALILAVALGTRLRRRRAYAYAY